MEIFKEKLDAEQKQAVYQGFYDHAMETIGMSCPMEELTFIAKEEQEPIGLCHCKQFWGALHIKYLFVESNFRGRGVATTLLSAALKEAQAFNLNFAFVETMSFQAVGFYKKLGFKEDFARQGYAGNQSFHYLSKEL